MVSFLIFIHAMRGNSGPPTLQSAAPFQPEGNPFTSGKRMAGQGLFSEKSVRMLGECEGRSGLSFSAHAPDASETRPCH
jgi:hypothetical protein